MLISVTAVTMRWRLLLALCLAVVPATTSLAEPLKLAGFAQINVLGDAAVGTLTNGRILRGSGWINRMSWVSSNEVPRSYFAGLDINRFAWTPLAVQFLPQSNGMVNVTLSGPWEEQSPGVLYRQDVLFDDVSATGAAFTNGGFEVGTNGQVAGWSWWTGPPETATNEPAPAEGARYVAAWTRNSLSQSVAVTGGVPVSLWICARARTPTNYDEMSRIASTTTAAHQAARRFLRGVNLGNDLEAPAGQDWGAHYTTNDFPRIRAEGFDHVRIPCAWQHHTGPGPVYVISNSFFAAADFLVTNALANGINVIVNIHHFDDLTSNPPAYTNKFYALWEQISAHYSNAPPALAFELLNEPKDAATTAMMNPIYAEAIRRIRQVQPDRTIFVGPGRWNNIAELEGLRLPAGDSNLIVTVHDYEPFLFTHQGAEWTLPSTATTNVVYPGPPPAPLTPDPAAASSPGVQAWFDGYNALEQALNPCSRLAFEDRLRLARGWSDYYGRPVHVGEWGCYTKAAAASRERYHREKRALLDELKLGWALWDWKAGFRYWDDQGNQPAPGLREALFPPPAFLSRTNLHVQVSGAVGKTYRLERSWSLAAQVWDVLGTQTLDAAALEWELPPAETSAYFRVSWLY
jgi:endoglucanase